MKKGRTNPYEFKKYLFQDNGFRVGEAPLGVGNRCGIRGNPRYPIGHSTAFTYPLSGSLANRRSAVITAR